MFIKDTGTYLALGDHYCMIFRAVGSFPFFRIPTAIVLNDYIRGGEIRIVKENEVEIQGLLNHPEKFAISSLNALTDDGTFKDFDTETGGIVDIGDPEAEAKYIEKLKYIDMAFSGIHINSLVHDITSEQGMSLPQARMAISVLRKKIKDERNRSNRID